MKKILITGVHGQVGYELALRLAKDFAVTGSDLAPEGPDVEGNFEYVTLDLTNLDRLQDFLASYTWDLIINPAAYTATDQAEDDEGVARTLNAKVPELIAKHCAAKKIPMFHYSTDYVFDGKGTHHRDEKEKPAPLSVYGRTKLEGEQAIATSGCPYITFRTAWVYSYRGKNFFLTMAKFAKEREELRVIDDQIGSPTSALFLADVTAELATRYFSGTNDPFQHSGVYHLVNGEETSWHGFTLEIIELLREHEELAVKDVKKITSDEFPARIERPKNSRLNCASFESTFGIKRPTWKESLREIVLRYRELTRES